MSLLHANPILIKELRSRMRGPRAFIILTAFLLLLGLFTYGMYRITSLTPPGFGGAPMGAVIGRSLFLGLAFFELMLVCLITPALTAGAISSEAERRTLDMLLATPLRAASVLWGKLLSALTYVFLLILAGVPMASIVFLLGGVTLTDMIQALAILVLCAVTFGTLGLFTSAWLRRTGRATVAAYVVLLLLMFATYFIYIVVYATRNAEPTRAILFANPISAMAAAAGGDANPNMFGGGVGFLGMLTPLAWVLSGSAGRFMGGMPQPDNMVLRPLWHYTAGIYLVATVVLYLLSVQLLKPIRRWRIGRTSLIAAVVAFVLLVVVAYGFYGPTSYARFGYPSLPTPTPAPIPTPAMAFPASQPPMPEPTATPVETPTPADTPTPAGTPAPATAPPSQ